MVKVPKARGSFRNVSQTVVSAAAMGGLLLSPLGGAAQPIDTTELVPPDAELSSHGFTNIRGVRELEDGRILLTDSRERRLVVVDLATSEIQQVGRAGEGPGEYQNPGRLYAVRGDTSLLTDVGTRRWFLLEGIDIVETFPPGRVANRMLGALLSGVDRRGRLLGVEGYGYSQVEIPGGRYTADSLRVWLIDSLSEDPAMETIARIGGRARGGIRLSSSGPYRFVSANPLATEEQAQLFPDGWIAVARTDPYRVDWRRPDGSWVRGEPLPSPPIEVDEAERCLVFERAGGAAPSPNCEDDRLPPFPEELPPFLPSALLPAPDGRLLVERTPSAKVPGRRYDLVDRNGVLTEVLVLPEDRQIVAFGPTSVYVIRTDELDLQWLTRHPFG